MERIVRLAWLRAPLDPTLAKILLLVAAKFTHPNYEVPANRTDARIASYVFARHCDDVVGCDGARIPLAWRHHALTGMKSMAFGQTAMLGAFEVSLSLPIAFTNARSDSHPIAIIPVPLRDGAAMRVSIGF
jgi:hypothetical protein